MDSELSILKSRGLQEKPAKPVQAPADAVVASALYQKSVHAFEEAVSRIDTYRGERAQPGASLRIQEFIDEAHRLASEIRQRAAALNSFPRCFIAIGSEAVFYSELASAADEAFERRRSALETLEIALGHGRSASTTYPLIDLTRHESFKAGHLAKRHIAQTMRDFERRWLDEDRKEGVVRKTLSSFIGDPGLGARDPMVQRIVSRAIHLNRGTIERAKDGKKLYVPMNELIEIGYVKTRGESPRLTKYGVLVLFKDDSHPDGFRIHTATLGKKYAHGN